MTTAKRDVKIRNRLGMHARAAVKFVQLANRYRSDVQVVKDGNEANGKSIMGLLTLVAAHGTSMSLICEGVATTRSEILQPVNTSNAMMLWKSNGSAMAARNFFPSSRASGRIM